MTTTATPDTPEATYAVDYDQAALAALMAPFPANEIGKLPRVNCGNCNAKRNCDRHRMERCTGCGNYMTSGHMHIDYVGHADVTRRLLSVDPDWDWRPLGVDEQGLPAFDLDGNGVPVGLWIELTVGGKTRLGFGSVPSNQSDAVKVLIGDAIRNAAMRFGVALDLWAKGERDNLSANVPSGAGATPAARQTRAERAAVDPDGPIPLRRAVADLCVDQGWEIAEVQARFEAAYKVPAAKANAESLREFLAELRQEAELASEQARQTEAGES